jgi:phospholipase C
MSLAGYTPVSGDYGPPPYIPFNQTIFAELDNHGVSWGYYVQGFDGTPYPLKYFYGAKSLNVGGVTDFETQLSNGTLPSVSWVMPVGGCESEFDQHPPHNVTAGELWLMGVVDHVMESRYWGTRLCLSPTMRAAAIMTMSHPKY